MKCIFFDKVKGIFNQRELQIKHHRKLIKKHKDNYVF